MDIAVTAYSSLVSGSENPSIKLGAVADIFKDEVLIEIAKAHNKTVA